MVILDRHLEWRSLDPTLDISSTFVKKHSASFFSFASFSFKRDPTFHKNASFLLHLVIRPVICMVVRCFPICFNRFPNGSLHYFLLFFPLWLSSILSHLMVIFDANEIRTFSKVLISFHFHYAKRHVARRSLWPKASLTFFVNGKTLFILTILEDLLIFLDQTLSK